MSEKLPAPELETGIWKSTGWCFSFKDRLALIRAHA